MSLMVRKFFAPAVIAAALAGGVLSAHSVLAQEPKQGGTLNVGFASDSKTMDPLMSVQSSERQVLYLVFNTLVKYNKDFSLAPELAKSWEIQNDGQKIVFKLQENVKFQDGTPFDAAAVKWNIEKRLDPKTGSPQRDQLAPIIDSVEVVDPTTVVFNLKGRFPSLLSLLGERPGFMVSPTAYEKSQEDFANHPVGTGPFVFKNWVRGSALTVERNPDYWEKGLPHLDKIVFKDLAGSVIGVQRLLTKELDFVPDLSPQEIRPIETNANIAVKPITVGRWYSLQWQVDKPPFNDLRVRQAFAYALDRDRINKIVMQGRGVISEGPTPAGLWWYDESIKSLPYDPEKAKQLLKEAGIEPGLKVSLSAPQIPAFQQISQLVQEQLAAVGVTATLQPVSANDWFAKIVDKSTNFTPTRWTQRPDPDGLLYILFHSKGFQNTTAYNNPEIDQLLDKARQTYDQAERKKLYSEAQTKIVAELPMVPLFFSAEYAAMRKPVENFEWIPDQIPRFREVWLNQ